MLGAHNTWNCNAAGSLRARVWSAIVAGHLPRLSINRGKKQDGGRLGDWVWGSFTFAEASSLEEGAMTSTPEPAVAE